MNMEGHTSISLRYITLVFVVVFLLIKLSPQYFAWQNAPNGRHLEVSARSFRCAKSTHQLLIIVDKSIFERRAEASVPAPKRIDLLFILFSSGAMPFNMLFRQRLVHCFSQLSNARLARLGIFRL